MAKLGFPTMAPAEPDGHETLDQIVNALTLPEIEAMQVFLKAQFEMFGVETVWDEAKSRTVQVRVVNSIPPEVSNLYRLAIGVAVWYEVKHMTQLQMF